MNFAAFASYILLTAFTPGPNNIMAMSTAGKYGFKKGLRFCVGVSFGFLVVMSCCAAGSTLLYHFIPKIQPVMEYVGAAYILWLAWTIYRDKPHEEGKPEKKKMKIMESLIFSGMVLQLINVKVILYGVTAFSTFILPYYNSIPILVIFVLILSLVGFAGTLCWGGFGAVFDKVFKEHKKGLNIVMALMLVYCAVAIVI